MQLHLTQSELHNNPLNIEIMIPKKGLIVELPDNLGFGVILDILRHNSNTYKLTICMADGGIMIGKFTPSCIDYQVYDTVKLAEVLRNDIPSV